MKKSLTVFIILSVIFFIAFFGTLGITEYILNERSGQEQYTRVYIEQLTPINVSSDLFSVPELPDIGASPVSNVCSATLEITDSWPVNLKTGGRYVLTLRNDSPYDITDLQLTLSPPEGYTISDFWGGEYTQVGNNLVIVPSMRTLYSDASRSIGFIMETNVSVYPIPEMNVLFHEELLLKNTPIFKISVCALAVYLLVALIFVISFSYRYQNKQREDRDHEIILQSLKCFASIIDAKDEYTKGHSIRVAAYSKELAKRLGMNEEEQRRIYYIGLLHDIGKIGVSDSILQKPGALTDTEREQVKQHVVTGGAILKDFTAIEGISDGARYHHERYDGMGYCEGLCGTDIPLVARIICVADSFDAMSSARCYRPKASIPYIILELRDNFGKQFDPVIAQHMLDMIDEGVAPFDASGSVMDVIE